VHSVLGGDFASSLLEPPRGFTRKITLFRPPPAASPRPRDDHCFSPKTFLLLVGLALACWYRKTRQYNGNHVEVVGRVALSIGALHAMWRDNSARSSWIRRHLTKLPCGLR